MSSIRHLQLENDELRRRLSEAEEALAAIRDGQVDAIVVDGERGPQVFSLTGAERIYRVLVETMNEAALTVAPDGTILFCNQRFCDLMHTPMPEAVGRRLERFAAAEERADLMALVAAARAGTARRQFVLLASDGTPVPVQLAATPLESGESSSVCVIASDLTELEKSARAIQVLKEHERAMKAAEHAFQGERDRLAALVRSINDEVWFADATGRFTLVNPTGSQEFNLEEGASIDVRQFAERLIVLRPDGTPRPLEETPALRALHGEIVTKEEELIRTPATGALRCRQVSSAPVRDASGGIIGSVSVVRDITEQKRAEKERQEDEAARRVDEAVRAERQRLNGVLETLPAMICLLTPDYHVAFANKSFRDRFGESGGQRCYEYCYGQTEPCSFCETFTVLRTGRPHHWEVYSPDGSIIDAYDFPFTDADGSPMILEMNLDITKARRAEEELRSAKNGLEERALQLRALAGELTLSEQRERRRLARVLHDHLQQLLVAAKFRTAIVGRLGDDLMKQAAAEIERLLDESISSSRLLTSELSPPILQDAGLPGGLAWLARWMADRHGLRVEVSVEEGLPPLAEDVSVLLFESVRELLFNAAKHANVPSANVSVRRVSLRDLRITVSDNGEGFDPGEVKPGGETGRGFGLFSIRERLELLGGEMDIDSAPGQGARIALTAPIGHAAVPRAPDAMAAPPPAAGEPAPVDTTAAPVGLIRVLIADDHALFREGLSRLLSEDPGIEVAGEAADGLEAVTLAGTLRPDVILMDVSMPKISGIEATRVIHRDHPGIRIIGLSMFEDLDHSLAMRSAGAVDYATKGGPPHNLLAAIRRAVEPQAS